MASVRPDGVKRGRVLRVIREHLLMDARLTSVSRLCEKPEKQNEGIANDIEVIVSKPAQKTVK